MTKKLSARTLALKRERRKITAAKCCLGDMLLELMNEWEVEAADIHKATGIPHSTLSDYINFRVKSPLLDGNILALSRYFNCSISYLAFGIGEEPVRPDSPSVDQGALNKAIREQK